jgi:catalase
VPGIDFTNDPLLQGRLFSYRDTQLSRLGTPNFHQIPINRPLAEAHNNQRDGQMQMQIPKGQTAYFPNSLGGGCPYLSTVSEGGFEAYQERIDANKIRGRSDSFSDHFSQPALFYRSLAEWEKVHVTDAYSFELGKCTHDHIKERMLWLIAQIDTKLANKVAANLGLEVPENIEKPINQSIGADAKITDHQPSKKKIYLDEAPTLSQANTKFNSIATRQVAFLVADGFNMDDFNQMKKALEKEKAIVKVVAPHGGTITCDTDMVHKVDAAIMTTESVLYDAVFIPGGEKSLQAILMKSKYIKFIDEAFKHCKAIAVTNEGIQLLNKSSIKGFKSDKAIFIDGKTSDFIKAIAQHRNWDRMENAEKIAV